MSILDLVALSEAMLLLGAFGLLESLLIAIDQLCSWTCRCKRKAREMTLPNNKCPRGRRLLSRGKSTGLTNMQSGYRYLMQGISASLRANNPFVWTVKMKGPERTAWEGSNFVLEIHYHELYNDVAPSVYFLTVPFHPNIDITTGRPCISILDDPDQWSPNLRISQVLVMIQNMFVEPDLSNPVNAHAAALYQNSRHLFDQLSKDAVVASLRLDVGAPVFDSMAVTPKVVAVEKPQKSKRSIEKVKYDQYYEEWKKAATSLTFVRRISPNSFLPSGQPVLDRDKLRMTGEHFQEKNNLGVDQVKILISRQHDLWFGKFQAPKPKILHRMNNQQPKPLSATDRNTIVIPSGTYLPELPEFHLNSEAPPMKQEAEWEKDAENLVEWSISLP